MLLCYYVLIQLDNILTARHIYYQGVTKSNCYLCFAWKPLCSVLSLTQSNTLFVYCDSPWWSQTAHWGMIHWSMNGLEFYYSSILLCLFSDYAHITQNSAINLAKFCLWPWEGWQALAFFVAFTTSLTFCFHPKQICYPKRTMKFRCPVSELNVHALIAR